MEPSKLSDLHLPLVNQISPASCTRSIDSDVNDTVSENSEKSEMDCLGARPYKRAKN